MCSKLINTLLFPFLLLFPLHIWSQTSELDYGATAEQINILNLDCLHQRGFTGKGVNIAHFDDGYDGFDKLEVFEHCRSKNLMKAAYDFVTDEEMVYTGLGSHGTNTVSIVHGCLPGKYIGTAFDASLLLARTEDNRSESHQEETNWQKAVDWALKNEVDIITSSLQYNNFDPGEGNYTYKDMDGKTTIITKAANYAAQKGILVVTIQGNFGNDTWHYVTAPGDSEVVMTVGAVNPQGKKADFSSFGPSADGRIKPDVMAVGEQTQVVDPNGRIRPGNGTSFAAPAMAGLAACLVQAHPDRSNMEIITAIRQSSDRYLDPDKKDGYGYGIPDACKADEILSEMDARFDKKDETFGVEGFQYRSKGTMIKLMTTSKDQQKEVADISLHNATEAEILHYSGFKKKLKMKSLNPGNYILKIYLKNGEAIVENLFLHGN